MGLCSLALVAQGANVLATDLAAVLPLLRANCATNLSSGALAAVWTSWHRAHTLSNRGIPYQREPDSAGIPWAAEAGELKVQELDWYSEDDRAAAVRGGAFDLVVAADCVYSEEHVEAFRDTCLGVMSQKATLVVINELRSEAVQSRFVSRMAEHFSCKKVLHSRMGPVQHPLIDILIFKRRAPTIA